MKKIMSHTINDETFVQGQGFTEFELHNKINTVINDSLNQSLSGRDINLVITVETKRDLTNKSREYVVMVLDDRE